MNLHVMVKGEAVLAILLWPPSTPSTPFLAVLPFLLCLRQLLYTSGFPWDVSGTSTACSTASTYQLKLTYSSGGGSSSSACFVVEFAGGLLSNLCPSLPWKTFYDVDVVGLGFEVGE
jgi:hypothetical protein